MQADPGAARDEVTLAARILTASLFLVFGWGKLMHPVAAAGLFARLGVPFPALACAVAVVAELGGGLALLGGLLTRPLTVLLAAYTLATALVGHRFWAMTGDARLANQINFFKNVSIAGGLLALFVTGPGRYSIDQPLRRVRRPRR